MQPFEVVRQALRRAPHDVDRYLAWHINSTPPNQRQTLHERILAALNDGRLSGEFEGPVQGPRLFTAAAASQTWEDLSTLLTEDEASGAAHFFKPSDNHFSPQAYPARWAPAQWNEALEPEEVRAALELTPREVLELKEIAEALIANQRDSNVPALRKPEPSKLWKNPLRVGVLPYVDVLPLATLFYAIKDLVDGISFGPASFFQCKMEGRETSAIDDGEFNVGYATAYQMASMTNKGLALESHDVFAEGFTRSLLTRIESEHKLPHLLLVSFVGQFGPDGTTALLSETSDPARRSKLAFYEDFRIWEAIDAIGNWEIPLILAFASGINGLPATHDGLALTLSTDAHLWAASFGLNLRSDRGKSDQAYQPTFHHALWKPTKQDNSTDGDINSQLCWFIPDVGAKSTDHKNLLQKLIRSKITQKIDNIIRDQAHSKESDKLKLTRTRLAPLARALLSPLLSAVPNYRGPMLSAPPEAWMTKIGDAGDYVHYRPTWFGADDDDKAPDALEAPLLDDDLRQASGA